MASHQVAHEGLNSHSKIERLPLELWERILGFQGMTRSVIRLYTSGSPLMRQRICRSATIMRLESFKTPDFTLLPSILAELTSLRSLFVICLGNPLLGIPQTINLLKRVSPTLQKLVLRCEHALDFCEPDPALRTWHETASSRLSTDNELLTASDAYVDLTACFPNLQWLELDDPYDPPHNPPQTLPPTLTHLECNINLPEKTSSIALPSSLIHLKVLSSPQLPQIFWDALPEGLETLDLTFSYQSSYMLLEQVKALPRSLKSLILLPWTPISQDIKALPPHLETITNLSNDKCKSLDGLPSWPTLTRLELSDLWPDSTTLHLLSRALTSLQITILAFDTLQAGDLPPLLTELKITTSKSNDVLDGSVFLGMPHLRTLCIWSSSISTAIINQLPPYLTELSLSSDHSMKGDVPAVFPPCLVALRINSDSNLPLAIYGSLPRTLTSADLGYIPMKTLYLLPPRLRRLRFRCNDLWEFKDTSTLAVERIKHLRKEALHDGSFSIEEFEACTRRRAGPFDLLPRTLTYLWFESEFMEFDAGWQSIPSNLSSLTIFYVSNEVSTPLPIDDLDYIPIESVTQELRLPISNFRDKHVKRLHPELRFLELERGPKCHLTLDGLLSLPRSIPWSSVRGDLVKGVEAIEEAQNLALQTLNRDMVRCTSSKSLLKFAKLESAKQTLKKV